MPHKRSSPLNESWSSFEGFHFNLTRSDVPAPNPLAQRNVVSPLTTLSKNGELPGFGHDDDSDHYMSQNIITEHKIFYPGQFQHKRQKFQ